MKFKLRFIFFFSPQTGKIEIYLGIRHFIWNMTKLNCKNVSSFHITAWAKKNLFIQFMICLNYIWFVYVWRALTTAHSSAMQKLFIFKLYIVYLYLNFQRILLRSFSFSTRMLWFVHTAYAAILEAVETFTNVQFLGTGEREWKKQWSLLLIHSAEEW